jgi:Putative Ig domain
MFKTATTLKSESAFLDCHSRYSAALWQRVSVLVFLLAATLLTTSCGTAAQAAGAAGTGTPHTLALHGNFPTGTVNESYNAVLAVGGGNSPYHFSVKTGALPPGVILSPNTGSFSGKPTTAGNYSFEVIVTDAPHLDEGSQTFSLLVNNGGGGGGGGVKVSVSPTSATLVSGAKQQFTATVSGTSDTAVTWTATTGTINASGIYTAPTVTSATNVTVTATSQADTKKSASAAVTVDPVNQQPLKIATGGLPQGQQGNAYNEVFSATGGTTPYSWSISAGTPPPGIALNANGDLAGMPTAAGSFSFTVMVTDAAKKTATGNFSVTVVAGGNFDGPAELPRVSVPSAMSDTPAPGSVISVNSGGDLQAAMNSAHCGDTIQLQAGATFSGKFTIPAKSCDNNHWIIIRTSSSDSALPAEGQRLTPCYGGVASLEGRPQYSCSNPKNVLARVEMITHDDGPFQFANGANFYRFIGLEVTRPVGTPGAAVLFSGQGTADHLIFDRLWLHGQPQDETHNGVSMAGMTNVAVIDSYLNDFKCIAGTGKCTDGHAISGGVSDTQDGPYKIQNNFLEASTEAIMFGGGAATMTPTDITITNNHFWKPMQWMQGNNPYVGGPDGHPFVVKNHLEMKNAVRVLVEANLMENSWGGFSQTGYGILLTPKNQHTPSGSNVCPICQVTDVTVRYVHISHGGGGIQMATALSGNGSGGAPALAGTRWSIHDVVIDDLNKKYVGGGTAFEILNDWPKNPLNTITINHVTAFPDPGSHVMITGNLSQNASMYALVFTNNLVITGQYPVWNTGGGSSSCAFKDVPVTTIDSCFATYTFGNNGLIATPSTFPPSSWPKNNLFPADVSAVLFMNFNNGNGGNYELQSSSPYKAKGSDGKDLGADIVGLNEALANVE